MDKEKAAKLLFSRPYSWLDAAEEKEVSEYLGLQKCVEDNLEYLKQI